MAEPHVLMIPYVMHGHITPMLSLASQLVALGCRVTFVKGERSGVEAAASGGSTAIAPTDEKQEEESMRNKVGAQEEERLVFVRVGGWRDQSGAVGIEALTKELEVLEQTRKPLVTRLLKDSQASAHPISCIISDFFMWKWMSPLALSLHLPLAFLNVWSTTFFYLLVLENKCKYSEMEELLVSGFGLLSWLFDDGVWTSTDPLEKQKTTDFFHDLFEGFEDAGHIVFTNSFKHLEAPLLPFLEASTLGFKFIGPCLPTWNTDNVGLMAQCAGSAFSEESSCMPWLDKQEKGSVLFVSFGSLATMSSVEQMEELAMGIENSGHKFLWVVRKSAMGLPEAFRERIERAGGERGMFASWVPQTKVLQHPSVGGFLTHSGWNSTVEGMTFGVPMLGLPFFGDQPLQANMAQWYWKVGVRLGPSKLEGSLLIEREEVERGVRTIMEGHTSQRVAHFQQAAQSAMEDARQTLSSFVQAIGEPK